MKPTSVPGVRCCVIMLWPSVLLKKRADFVMLLCADVIGDLFYMSRLSLTSQRRGVCTDMRHRSLACLFNEGTAIFLTSRFPASYISRATKTEVCKTLLLWGLLDSFTYSSANLNLHAR